MISIRTYARVSESDDLLETKVETKHGGPFAVLESVTTYLILLTPGDSVWAGDIGPIISSKAQG